MDNLEGVCEVLDLFDLRQAKAEDDGAHVTLEEVEKRLREDVGEDWETVI